MQIPESEVGREATIVLNAFGKTTLDPILREIYLSILAATFIPTKGLVTMIP